MQNVTDETVCVLECPMENSPQSYLSPQQLCFFFLKKPHSTHWPNGSVIKMSFISFFCIEIIRMRLQCTHYSWDKKCIYLKNENVYYHLNYYLCQISKLIFSFLFLARCGGCLLFLKGFVWRRLFLRELSLFHTQSIHRIEKAFVGRISHLTLLHCIAYGEIIKVKRTKRIRILLWWWATRKDCVKAPCDPA